MQFGFAPPPFGALWPRIVDLLAPAVERDKNDWADLAGCLSDGRAQIWLTLDPEPVAAMVTRRDGDILEVWLAGGAVLAGSVPFLEVAISAAKRDGATSGRITGRPGWARVLRNYGWQRCGEDLVKDFT